MQNAIIIYTQQYYMNYLSITNIFLSIRNGIRFYRVRGCSGCNRKNFTNGSTYVISLNVVLNIALLVSNYYLLYDL